MSTQPYTSFFVHTLRTFGPLQFGLKIGVFTGRVFVPTDRNLVLLTRRRKNAERNIYPTHHRYRDVLRLVDTTGRQTGVQSGTTALIRPRSVCTIPPLLTLRLRFPTLARLG